MQKTDFIAIIMARVTQQPAGEIERTTSGLQRKGRAKDF
jgi:hypothetical protein